MVRRGTHFLGVTCKGESQVCPSPVAAQCPGSMASPVAITAARSFALSLLDTTSPGVDGDVPSMQDVLCEGRHFLRLTDNPSLFSEKKTFPQSEVVAFERSCDVGRCLSAGFQPSLRVVGDRVWRHSRAS